MRFTAHDAQLFADWSGDRNPLYVDESVGRRTAFGGRIAPGVLAVIRAVADAGLPRPLRRLEIEFRGGVYIGQPCAIERASGVEGLSLAVRSEGAVALTLRGDGAPATVIADPAWPLPFPPADAVDASRPAPADRTAAILEGHVETAGLYRTGDVPAEMTHAGLPPLHVRVLGLCSYVAGMELPGLRSVLAKLTVRFGDATTDSPLLAYRARTLRYDPRFRLLDTSIEVAAPSGDLVAAAELRTYLRTTPSIVEPADLSRHLAAGTAALAGRVALVCGGSRGLGAEIAAALAMAGSQVYAAYDTDTSGALELAQAVERAGASIRMLQGDVSDPAWCDATGRAIESEHGGIDLLVLNACAVPRPLRLSADSVRAFSAFVEQNLALAQVPLAAFLPSLERRRGTVVCISSSLVEEPATGYGHYVALKQAVEAMVKSATRESGGVRALIARPPRLQTAWHDTAAGIVGAIPASQAAVHIVNRVARPVPDGEAGLLTDFPALPPPAAPERDSDLPPEFTLALSASFTSDPIVSGLRFWFSELGLRGEVESAPYGQVLQALLNPAGPLSGRTRGLHVVLMRVRDWLRELPPEQGASMEFVRTYLETTARDLERAMRTHRGQSAAETLLVFCPSAAERPGEEEAIIQATESGLAASLRGLPGLTVVRAEEFHPVYGVDGDAVGDRVRERIAHIPYRAGYFHTLATIVMRHVHRKLAPARKVVVVDCDNTLWRGVVGEVGSEGLAFDAGHAALHAALARLSASGVLIALCSKNEEADVWRVFETRPDFGLSRDLIVTAAINWQPKSQNLKSLAARLNLGLDSFVFIDDNPVECAEVRSACPEVLTIQWPQEPERATRLLEHVWELDSRAATTEDQRRTELYKEEFRRQELQSQTLTFRDFIDSLGLVVDIAPLAPADLKRASQLTLRTNQFNFTTRRRDEGEVQALVDAGTHEVRTVRVRDRFGDYGLVGLLIAEPRGDELLADTFLVSCRVLGRGVEHQMAAEFGRIAQSRGAGAVRLRVEPTKRNTPARAFLEAIAPESLRTVTDGVIEANFPADRLAALEFEPPEQAGPAIAEDDKSKGSQPPDTARIRAREAQIARSAFELSTPDGLLRAIDGDTARPAAAPRLEADAASAFVYDAFAAALGVTAAQVRAVDGLEALGCDSFKIVEITVSLLEQFPSLPGTLLFEHRAVSEIARRVVELTGGGPAPAAPPARIAEPTGTRTSGDIAVVGMHLRCAGADSPADLWKLLSGGRVAVTPVPHERPFFFGELDDERPHWAGLLENLDRFDAELFGVTPREAELMDPQLRMFLEVAWGALEDAGCLGDGLEPDTGVFSGQMYGDYGPHANLVARHTGNPFKCWEAFSLANRVSFLFGYRGPSLAVDTACSSTGTALHLACRALLAGDCRVALVGGVNLMLEPDRLVQLGRLGILSASGRCMPFGDEADGTVMGEGAGAVVLRPLADALARGDRVYGVIKGVGVSTGSGTVGFTAPNPQAQAVAIRRAIAAAGVDPRSVSYVETHGTGTALGDPIEVRGLTLAYSDRTLWDPAVKGTQACSIGSIKPNIGHLEAGAGVLGLIKVLLQFAHGALAPSITSAKPNPQIPFEQTPFSIQRTLSAWNRPVMDVGGTPVALPRRAALNSFGVGGANAHLILEEPPSASVAAPGVERPQHLLALSARSEESLNRRLDQLAAFIDAHPAASLADVCFSLNTGHRHLERRAAVPVETREQVTAALRELAAGGEPAGAARGTLARSAAAPGIAFLFTGQGSQYVGMGRGLYETQPVFRDALDRCFTLFDERLDRSLRALMFAAEGSAEGQLLNQTGFTQPALFAVEYALAQLWMSWGVTPSVVLGHSVGEISAMCVAGGLSLEDATTLIAARGRLMQALPAGGAMTSVMASEARVLEAIAGAEDRVAAAAINGPEQVVISGDGDTVAAIAVRLAASGVKTKPLVVSHAFHSPLMRPMLADYEAIVRTVQFAQPGPTFASCVDGRAVGAELLQPGYWVRNVIDPVRFTDGIAAAEAAGARAFVEVGPQPVLLGMARQCLRAIEDERLWLPSMRREGDAWSALLASLGRLYAAGVDVDWRGFDAPYQRRRVSVPAYPFAGKRYWLHAVVRRPELLASADAAELSAPADAQEAGDHGVETGAAAYEVAWKPQPLSRTLPDRVEGTWLVFGDRQGVGSALAVKLEQRGARCDVTPLDADANLASALGQAGATGGSGALSGIVYAWAFDRPTAPGPDAAETGAEQLGSLMQAIASHRPTPGSPSPLLWVVTRDAKAVAQDPPAARSEERGANPAQSSLWGLARTFSLEHPACWGGLIDLETGTTRDADADAILREILVSDGEDQVAVRGERRYVARLRRRVAGAPGAFEVASDRAYLITGGSGALGVHVARWLAGKGARRIVLASRRGLAAPGLDVALRELEALGATVSIVSADVATPAGVDAALDVVAGLGGLAGVFHAAGIDELRAVQDLRGGDVARVMAAKARGAWLLHQRASGDGPFVLFSSMAAVLGSAGRSAYAAANGFLDGLAEHRRAAGLHALSVNWGPWAGGGMAGETALQQYAKVGNRGLDPASAIAQLESLLGAGATTAVVVDIDWTAFRAAYEARRPRPLVAELLSAPGAAATGGRGGTRAPWVDRLESLPASARLAELVTLLRQEVAITLGFDGPADVPPDQAFQDMGMDSLMSADFAQRLQKRLGIRSTALVFDHPFVEPLATHLLERLALADAPSIDARAGGSAPAGDAAAPTDGGASTPPVEVETGRFTEHYRASVEEEVFEFQKRAWPHRRPDWIAPRWRWMFVESARRLGVEPQVWLHRDRGTIVGHNGAIPVVLKLGREERLTAWLVETMVAETHRSLAVGARLTVEAGEDLPFALSLGQTEQMRAIQFKLGWEQVAPLQTAQLLIRPENVLKGKLPAPAALAAGWGLRASIAVRDAWKQKPAGEVREVARFGAEHDRIWESMARGLTCAVRRDASYLNWKYVDQPGQAFLRLELSDARGPRGIVVCMLREPDDAYRYRRAFVVDLVAPLENRHLLADLLQVATDAVTARGADSLLCLHIHGALTAALRQAGFRLREPSRFLLVRPGPLGGAEREMVLSPAAWFVTQGDSDIDRPW